MPPQWDVRIRILKWNGYMHNPTMKKYSVFISDLHLQPERPDIAKLFFDWMREQATQADVIYILGDFFEAWVGDDDNHPFHEEVIQSLQALSQAGIPIYLITGNRDFLLGKMFAKKTGVTLLPEPSVINLYGRHALILHGDSLCTLDKKHQRYRKIAYRNWVKSLFLALPLKFRQMIARQFRHYSHEHNSTKSMNIMDVTEQAVIDIMQKYQVNLLIHGHTHRPQIHEFISNHQPMQRIVLGAWEITPKILYAFDDGELSLADVIIQ